MTWTWPPWGRSSDSGPGALPPLPRPDPPICVVGDVHGCAGLLERLLDVVQARPGADAARLVFVGDLIDRGPDSAGVLARLRGLQASAPERVIVLMGNHEAMCLEALDRPAAMTRWLMNGGDATLASFGISARRTAGDAKTWHSDLVAALRAAWPDGTEDWLRARPLFWQDGGLAVAHAAGDPAQPLEAQEADTLLWGHRRSLRDMRRDGLWMAHGHWIGAEVTMQDGRIAVDTGAFHSGCLSAAWLGPEGGEVICVSG